MLLFFIFLGVALSHQSDFTILPSSPTMHISYDIKKNVVKSESALIIAHFNSGFPLPTHLIPKDGTQRIQIATKRPHAVAYNFFRIKEYSSPIEMNIFTLNGNYSNPSERFNEIMSDFAGRKFKEIGKYDSSVIDLIHSTLISVETNATKDTGDYYFVEMAGDQSYYNYNFTESILQEYRKRKEGKSKYTEMYNYLMDSLDNVRKEWGLDDIQTSERIESIISFDFVNKVFNYSEISVIFNETMTIKYPKIEEDHIRLLTYLTSCGTDIMTKEHVCKFTRHRPANENGQVVTTPQIKRELPKGAFIQHLEYPKSNAFKNYSIEVSPLFMNASCFHCSVYYLYNLPSVVYFSEGDIKKITNQKLNIKVVSESPYHSHLILIQRNTSSFIDSFSIPFHVIPTAISEPFEIQIPLVFQKCPVHCSQHFLLNHLLEYNKNDSSIHEVYETSKINSILFGCTDTTINQVYDPHCEKQIVKGNTPKLLTWVDELMKYKNFIIIYTTSIFGLVILAAFFL
ncbi:hypothetical protein ENUP19_0158G0036 [Entamoeba nuttalli]|uniref:Uncharacterized protein n=2 Tax=Entamoeba nuttalli TaxID=412467 RepID=K2G9Q9_ENTNP|nr:hypothetical protein ENU1_140640 [Entamoeba nuttalli P19]EKE39136.1 hypothetical protein ENU1_140640 [Entamoeba nuttalli P19]|eukprot:XP_008858530.1 hypothetical protein ENU1_140640 [Entamoeba nuttalli P19]